MLGVGCVCVCVVCRAAFTGKADRFATWQTVTLQVRYIHTHIHIHTCIHTSETNGAFLSVVVCC